MSSSEPPEAGELVSRLAEGLACGGLDVATPLALSWYNNSTVAALGALIPARGAAGQAALCMLVGNSRAMWEPFVEACATQGLAELDNPLEAYMESRLRAALAAAAPGLAHRVYWSHRRTGDLQGTGGGVSEHVAFQRMAHFAGLAFLDETSHLCLHPRFGPWFSLRCCIIFDDVPYTAPPPPELPNPLPLATRQYVALALHTAVHNTSRKFHLPEVDVEAAEAVIAEASIEPVLEDDSDTEEGEGEQRRQPDSGAAAPDPAPALPAVPEPACHPGSSTRSTAGSGEAAGSGGTTPACSSGCSTPRGGGSGAATAELGGETGMTAAPPEPAAQAVLTNAAARMAAAAQPEAAPGGAAPEPAGPAGSQCGSGGSPTGDASGLPSLRRSSLEREGKPSMRAVAANWRAWVAVRDSPCPGHPWRYSEEQITYHYTRDRSVLVRALLRRGLGPSSPRMPATGLLDPALKAFHAATMEATAAGSRKVLNTAAAAAAPTLAVPTPGTPPAPAAVTAA